MGKNEVVFNGNEYIFLKKRALELGKVSIDILKCFDENEEMYQKEIQKSVACTHFVFRPVIYSLYSTGFLNKEEKAKMNFYSLSKNGKKLLKELKEEGRI